MFALPLVETAVCLFLLHRLPSHSRWLYVPGVLALHAGWGFGSLTG